MTELNPEEAKRVVIAEDNANTRAFIKRQLESLGFEVVGAAARGDEAVRLVQDLRPGLVILDVKMPGMDGIEAAKAITEKRPVPVVLVTGFTSDELTTRAVEAGIFAYLIKPVTKKHLEPAIKLALSRFAEFTSLKKEVKDLKEAIETRKLIERAKGILMKRCNISEEDAFKLLQAHSQRENRKMRDVAEMIVAASKLL